MGTAEADELRLWRQLAAKVSPGKDKRAGIQNSSRTTPREHNLKSQLTCAPFNPWPCLWDGQRKWGI